MNPIQAWQNFQNQIPCFQSVKQTLAQWLRRCQRFFQFQDTAMIIGFLQDEFQYD